MGSFLITKPMKCIIHIEKKKTVVFYQYSNSCQSLYYTDILKNVFLIPLEIFQVNDLNAAAHASGDSSVLI